MPGRNWFCYLTSRGVGRGMMQGPWNTVTPGFQGDILLVEEEGAKKRGDKKNCVGHTLKSAGPKPQCTSWLDCGTLDAACRLSGLRGA